MRLKFSPVLWTVSTIAVVILVALGSWQVQRLQWKNHLIAQVEARTRQAPVTIHEALALKAAGEDIEYLPVRVTGGFPSSSVAHVPGTLDGVPGAYAFQVMRLDEPSGQLLLLNRGFVPQDERAVEYPLPNSEDVIGLVRRYDGAKGLAAAFAPPDRPDDLVFFGRDKAVIGAALAPGQGDLFVPFVLDSQLDTALPRGRTTRLDFRNSHLGYAITWYGLAISLIIIVVAMSRKPRS